MAVWITLDKVDGTSKVKGPLHADEIDLTGLLFRLNESDLATITFTRANPLNSLIKKSEVCPKCGKEYSHDGRRGSNCEARDCRFSTRPRLANAE